MPTISQLLNTYKHQLGESRSGEILLAHVLKQSRAYLYTHPEKILEANEINHCNDLIKQRERGIPIAYLLGEKEFYSLNFKVTSDTLIPRPETEMLIDTALGLMPDAAQILDLGTGSGAIAVTLAYMRPHWQILATDISTAALEVATSNAKQHGLKNISFMQSHWFRDIPAQKFNLIISNPPYIALDDPHLAQGDVRFEPLHALTSGAQGLDDLMVIIRQARPYLSTQGWLIVEHGCDQAAAVQALFKASGFTHITTQADLAGLARMTRGQICS